MSTRDEIIERIGEAIHGTDWVTEDEAADWPDNAEYRTDQLAAVHRVIDALTTDDLLTLAGLVGDDAPFETVGPLEDARALWAARAAAVIPDALTLDDLLTLAGHVGSGAPRSHDRKRDAACLLSEEPKQ